MSTSYFGRPPSPPALWSLQSVRCHTMLLLGGLTMVHGLIRASMSMAIVCMVSITQPHQLTLPRNVIVWPTLQQILYNNDLYGISWTAYQQALVHSAFYIGGCLGVLPSSILIKRYRAKRILSCSLLLSATGCLLTPFLAVSLSYWSVAILQAVVGFGNGLVGPCSYAIVAKWFPATERATPLLILILGNHLGIMCSMVTTASIGHIKLVGGWPIAMEAYGIVGLALLVVWHVRVAHKPRYSSYVTATELAHVRDNRLRKGAHNVVPPVPMKKILFSRCVVVMGINFYAQSFIVTAFITYIPIFNHDVLKMDLLQNGITSFLPFFVEALSEMSFSLCGGIMKRRGLSATLTIKIFSVVAIFGVVSCILSLTIVGQAKNSVAAVLLALMLGFLAASSVGCTTILITIAPQFTRFVFTYILLYKHTAGVLSPVLVGALRVKEVEWQALFYFLAVLYAASGLLFVLFAHGRREVVVQLQQRDSPSASYSLLHEQISSHHQWRLAESRGLTTATYQSNEEVVLRTSEDPFPKEFEEFTSSEE